MVDVVKYCDRSVRKKDVVMLNSNNIPWTQNNESDDSDDEDVVAMGEFWPSPEDEWTVVKRPQKKTRGNHGSDRGRTDIPGRKWDKFELYYDELEEFIDTEALLSTQRDVPQITEMLPNLQTEKETVTVKVKPIVKQIPDEIGTVLLDIADGRDIGSVNVVVSPHGREHQEIGTKSKTEELFSDGREVIPNKMAEEASTGT